MSKLDILLAVESWLKPGSEFKITGFKTHRADRLLRGGGILFALKNDLKFEPIEVQINVDPSVEIAAIKIYGFSKPINIFTVYRAPGVEGRPKTLSQAQWDQIANLTLKEDGISYLLGDFNAHNIQWNCEYDNSNGKRFLDSLSGANLMVLNSTSVSHVNAYNNKTSNIDLVILDATTAAATVNVKVYDECFGSDYFPIQITVSLQKFIFRKNSFRLRSVKTNWEAVNIKLENR